MRTLLQVQGSARWLHDATTIAQRAEAPEWVTRRWTTVAEMVEAFRLGMEAARTDDPTTEVLRFQGDVGKQLTSYLHTLLDSASIAEVAPLQVEEMLRSFSRVHMVVRGWPVNRDKACLLAGAHLLNQATQEGQ